jgi:Uma2 family endonuclease
MIASTVAPATRASDTRFVLRGVSWQVYQALRLAPENDHLRMTYDRGALEIMSPSRRHEQVSYLLGRMIDAWTLFHEIEVAAGRTVTFSREDLGRGLEPDNCYWIRHESVVRGDRELDLTVDPPPDLVIEVEVTQSALPKMPILAALGVPEVWQWKNDQLQVLRLDARGRYRAKRSSGELPHFPIAAAAELLARRKTASETRIVREFLALVERNP